MPARQIYQLSKCLATAATIILLCASLQAQPNRGSGLFNRSQMHEMNVGNSRIWLGKPIQVTAQTGWRVSGSTFPPLLSFVHLTPFMARFPNGELIVTYALDPDVQDKPVTLSGFQISRDGGEHWGRRYGVLMQHIPMIFLPKPQNSLMAIASELFQKTPGDERNFQGSYYLFEQGGKRMVMVPDGIKVADWPWPTQVFSSPQPRDMWVAGLVLTGDAVKIGNRILATGYEKKRGDKTFTNVVLASVDGGYTWQYLSTIAGVDPSLVGLRNYEGPSETAIIQLSNGDLMAVFRVGGGLNLRRAYSHDQGRTWTKPESIPPLSVEPEMLRTHNGTILLATGRPGIRLWLSTDPRAKKWNSIDIVEYHNRCMTNPAYRISPLGRSSSTGWQTSSYTGLVEISPDKLLLTYDRDPEGEPAGPDDKSQVFVLPMEVERR